jgi:hypothetical protein
VLSNQLKLPDTQVIKPKATKTRIAFMTTTADVGV